MCWVIGILALVVLFYGWMYYAARSAPECTCGREDCGGGCRPNKGA